MIASRFRSRRSPDWPPAFPPPELMALVGHTSTETFDNPTGADVFADVPPDAAASVLDWGCGCGRFARRLLMQERRPTSYVGVDLHAGMIEWCRENLSIHDPAFRFHHHDIHNPALNPTGTSDMERFPVDDSSIGLFIGWSVFTHVTQRAAEFYLGEVARVLRPGGMAKTTWFLFDKSAFPMMQTFQNALFINEDDPTNAVIFASRWLLDQLTEHGLVLTAAVPPAIRGFHWLLTFEPATPGRDHVELPADDAPIGSKPPPTYSD